MEKILILPGGLQIGGAERVAANISKFADHRIFEFHYLVFAGNENVYGVEIQEKGGKVITVPQPRDGYIRYIKTLFRLMKEYDYSAIHSHTMFNSGINLAMAKLCRIPVRVAHSHTTKTEGKVSLAQRAYETIMRKVILHTATHFFACGVEAGNWLFGQSVFEKKGYVLHNGIDTETFAWSQNARKKIREQYHLENAFIIGHTGTLLKVKNQRFLIELMPEIVKVKKNAVLMLVGGDEGTEQERLETIAQELGIAERVIFCGAVLNVNEYLSAFDVFGFPSLREGTPLALLEAQANGLPCIVSENVPSDALLTDLVLVLPLDMPKQWIQHLCTAQRNCAEEYQKKLVDAGYDAKRAYAPIYDIYQQQNDTRKAIVSLSFDDGRGDNVQVVDEILIPRQMPATLNITTGYIDGTCPNELMPSKKAPIRKKDIVRLFHSPLIEIALHGDQHDNTPADILEGRRKLKCWLTTDDAYRFGFASPKSELSNEKWNSPEYRQLHSELLYMRGSYRLVSGKAVRTLCRKVGRVLHLPQLFKIAYQDTIMHFVQEKIVYSVCIHGDTTFEQVRALIDTCVRERGAVTLMFHSVLPDCSIEDTWSWDREKFVKLSDYLVEMRAEGKLDVLTTRELVERLG